jgi:hypothetical protein
MANALGPYYVQINYHYILGPHSMTIPTKNWNSGAGAGSFDTWAGGTVDAADMIEQLVTLMLPFFDANTTFDNWVIFKQLLPADDPQPMRSGNFTGMDGTNSGGSWSAAVESIITMRTDLFGIAKLDLLDSVSGGNYNPILTPSGALSALLLEWSLDLNGWSGRDNGRPSNFLKMTINLNQKLRKSYRLD